MIVNTAARTILLRFWLSVKARVLWGRPRRSPSYRSHLFSALFISARLVSLLFIERSSHILTVGPLYVSLRLSVTNILHQRPACLSGYFLLVLMQVPLSQGVCPGSPLFKKPSFSQELCLPYLALFFCVVLTNIWNSFSCVSSVLASTPTECQLYEGRVVSVHCWAPSPATVPGT